MDRWRLLHSLRIINIIQTLLMKKYLSLLIIMYSLTGNAQEIWTLERCVNYALSNNLKIKAANLTEDNADISIKQAKHARYPSLSIGSNFNSNFGRTIDPVTNTFITENFLSNGYSLNSGVILYNGNRINNAIKKTKADKEAIIYETEQTKRDIALNVINAYLQGIFAEENVKIVNNQKQTTINQWHQIQKLISSGIRPPSDSLDILAQLAADDQRLTSAQNQLEGALLNLKILLRLESDIKMNLAPPDIEEKQLEISILDFDNLYQKALQSQPNLKAASLRIQSARIDLEMAKSGLFPTVGAGATLRTNYSNKAQKFEGVKKEIIDQTLLINGNEVTVGFPREVPIFGENPYFNQLDENLSYGIGININMPLYSNYTHRANIQRAKVKQLQMKLREAQLQDQLKSTINKAILDVKAARKKYFASKKTVEAREKAFQNASLSYQKGGKMTLFELNQRKNLLSQAQRQALLSKYELAFAIKVLEYYYKY